MLRLFIVSCLLCATLPTAGVAQRVDQVRLGLEQIPSARLGAVVAPQAGRPVPWQTGAVVGFAVGVIGAVVLLHAGDRESSGAAIFIGFLGAIVGALGQAVFSSGPVSGGVG